MITGFFRRGKIASGKPLEYEEARELAGDRDPKVRRELAARTDMRPEILYFMAEDTDSEVRRRVAQNAATPVQASTVLVKDSDEAVRCGLADKIARLAPGLTADDKDKVQRLTYEVLDTLARDQMAKVRQIIAETLKDVANAPPEVMLRLARDTELSVAGPVLECSPVLSDEDLLDIIASAPVQGALSAISRRAEVRSKVADAIVASDDIDAIAGLLANPSAQIREETLDRLVDRAPDHETWHDPLVRRPQIPPKAAKRLARFVADNLLQVLRLRDDLEPNTAREVADAVRRRLDEKEQSAPVKAPAKAPPKVNPLERARKLDLERKLDESVVAQALAVGDQKFAIACLSVRAQLPLDMTEKILASHSPKGVTALAWKASLSMRFAVQVQIQLARISPSSVLNPRNGFDFPMSDAEMEWQLDFFSSLAEEGK